MMKSNRLGVLLTAVLVLTALATAGMFYGYVQTSRKLQPLQREVMIINGNQAAVQGLVVEALEYSKLNPSIDPVLQSMGIRPKIGVNSPATRPSGN